MRGKPKFEELESKLENIGDINEENIKLCSDMTCGNKVMCFEYQGKIEGNLSFPARGKKGFGYDPIFVPKGYAKTFAQISKIKKNQISHRYKAFIQIKKFFKFS